MPHIALAFRKVLEWQRCTHVDPLACGACGAPLIPQPHRDRTHVVLQCPDDGCVFMRDAVPTKVLDADLALCPETRPFVIPQE